MQHIYAHATGVPHVENSPTGSWSFTQPILLGVGLVIIVTLIVLALRSDKTYRDTGADKDIE